MKIVQTTASIYLLRTNQDDRDGPPLHGFCIDPSDELIARYRKALDDFEDVQRDLARIWAQVYSPPRQPLGR